METHDVVVECNKMSLDPVEGTWEELQCPILTSRYMIERSGSSQEGHRQTVPPLACNYRYLLLILPRFLSAQSI